MKVLITGGAGFIGSYLSTLLLEQGNHVTVLDNLSTGRRENIAHLETNPNFKFLFGNVCDKATMEPLVSDAEFIYHLAAPVGVKHIMQFPVLTILDNVRGIDVMTELTHKYSKQLLIASTSEVYGRSLDLLDPTGKRKLVEDDYRVEGATTNHRWAYANTKALDEFLSLAYHKQYGTKVVVVRFFNTVGPRQLSNYGMVIPNFVQRAVANQPIEVYGTGLQKRSFLHVKDAIRGITDLMNCDKAIGRVFNLGNPFEISILELAQKVIALANSKSEIVMVPYSAAYGEGFEDMNRRTADISRIQNTIGFKIEYDLDVILTDVINYHLS